MTWLFGTSNCPDVHNRQKTSAFASSTSTSTLLKMSIHSRTFSSDLTLKIFLWHIVASYRPSAWHRQTGRA